MKKLALLTAFLASPASAHVTGGLHGHQSDSSGVGAVLLVGALGVLGLGIRRALRAGK